MVSTQFKTNKNIDNQTEQEILGYLNEIGNSNISSNDLKRIITSPNDFFYNLGNPDALDVIVSMSNHQDVLEIKFEESNFNFEFSDNLKKYFLFFMKKMSQSDMVFSSVRSSLEKVSNYEKRINKSVINFTEEEMITFLRECKGVYSFTTIRNLIFVYGKLQNFYLKYYKNNFSWSNFSTYDVLTSKLEFKNETDYAISQKNLDSLSKMLKSAQEAIIPVLLFEGLCLSDVDEKDEIRFLNKNDIGEKQITVRKFDGSVKRIIGINEDISEILKSAINETYQIDLNNGDSPLVALEESPHLLRRKKCATKKSPQTVLSYQEVKDRLEKIRFEFEFYLFDVNFEPEDLRLFGKIYYVDQFIKHGDNVINACKKVLIRFGEWEDNNNLNSEQKLNNASLRNLQENYYKYYKQ